MIIIIIINMIFEFLFAVFASRKNNITRYHQNTRPICDDWSVYGAEILSVSPFLRLFFLCFRYKIILKQIRRERPALALRNRILYTSRDRDYYYYCCCRYTCTYGNPTDCDHNGRNDATASAVRRNSNRSSTITVKCTPKTNGIGKTVYRAECTIGIHTYR